MHCYFRSDDIIFLNVKSSLLMQYHLADSTVLYFDNEERNSATIGRKILEGFVPINSKISGLGSVIAFFFFLTF